MENLLTDLFSSKIDNSFLNKASVKMNATTDQTKSVVDQALPFLLGALAKNASTEEGATSLSNALKKDHDGSILDNLSELLDKPDSGAGEGILSHVLGGGQQKVEGYLSQKSGVDSGGVDQILKMLAPIVMGVLGKAQSKGNLDSSQLSGLLKLATGGTGSSSITTSFVTKFLDKNSDGDIKDDLVKMGMRWLSGKFKK